MSMGRQVSRARKVTREYSEPHVQFTSGAHKVQPSGLRLMMEQLGKTGPSLVHGLRAYERISSTGSLKRKINKQTYPVSLLEVKVVRLFPVENT